MDAIAPAALALSVTFDAVATLGMVLMSFEGPIGRAMFPMTGNPHINIATGLGDIVLLTLVRGCLVLLPMLGIAASLSWLGVTITAVAEAAMSAWLITKAVFIYQLADARRFQVAETGVTYHLPTVIAAEVLGTFMCWFLFALVLINRRVMLQPAANDPAAAVALSRSQVRQRQLRTSQWVSSTAAPEGYEGPEITTPLLAGAPAAGAMGVTAPRDEETAELESFVSATSMLPSSGSLGSAVSGNSHLEEL
eukprot:GHUV01027188.1.p1 GENE.GHUV01027188.1~~GHUV01027188.1.p1  ORF type:complete len:251 (-),score=62.57 GHUV01027188.1:388-1140(-)